MPKPARRSPVESVLALQRMAGNRAVRRLARAAVSQGESLADAVDLADEAARNHALWNREHYLYGRLVDPGESDRSGQLDQLRAVEKRIRGLGTGQRDRQYAAITLDEATEEAIAQRREAQRLIVWQKSADEGLAYAYAKAGTPAALMQVVLLREDLEFVKKQFRDLCFTNAHKILDASAGKIGDVLRAYGVMATHDDLVKNVMLGYMSHGEATAEWLNRAKTHDEYRGKSQTRMRADLGKTATDLSKLQKAYSRVKAEYDKALIAKHMSSAGGQAADVKLHALEQQVKAANAALNVAWMVDERRHKIFAAYRDEDVGELMDAGKAQGGDEAIRAILSHLIDTLINIKVAKARIGSSDPSPLKLAPIVALTRGQMMIPIGSYWDGAINDLIAEETHESFLKEVLGVVLAALSILPGGQVFALLGMALDLYNASNELRQYGIDKTMAGTDLDRAKALSDKDPSLAGFAWALVSAGLNAAAAQSAFKAAESLEARIASGDRKAIEELNKLGEEHGINNLGGETEERVLKEKGIAEGGEVKPVAEPKPGAAGARYSLPKGLERKLTAALEKALKSRGIKSGMKVADLPPDYKRLLDLLKQHEGLQAVADAQRMVPIVMEALRTPDLYAEVLGEALTRAVAHNTDFVTELKAMAKESGMTLVETRPEIEEADKFYENLAARNIAIVDKAFTGGPHGELTHLIQDLVVDRALNKAVFKVKGLKQATSGEFRNSLRELDTIVEFPDALKEGRPLVKMELGEAVWRGTYDLFDVRYMPTPEATNPRLQEALKEVLGTSWNPAMLP